MAPAPIPAEPPPQAEPPQEKAPISAGRLIGVAVAALFGAVVGSYCGWLLLVPMALAFGVGWTLTKVSAGPAAFRIPLAIVAAQALYLSLDIFLGGEWLQDAAHILLMAAGMAWLWARPGIGPVIFLSLYEIAICVLVANVYGSAPTGSWQHKSVVAQVCLRGAAVVFLGSGYVKTRKQRGKAAAEHV